MNMRDVLVGLYQIATGKDVPSTVDVVDNFLTNGWVLEIPCMTMELLTSVNLILRGLECEHNRRIIQNVTARFAPNPNLTPLPVCPWCTKPETETSGWLVGEDVTVECVHCGARFVGQLVYETTTLAFTSRRLGDPT